MSKEKSKNYSNELEKDFSDADLALDISPELNLTQQETPKVNKVSEEFQKEFKAVFDDNSNKDRKKFAVANSNGVASGLFDWIRCVIISIAIVVLCLTFVFRLVEVDGTSMNDTLAHHDKVIVTNLFYTPHNNDVIVISHGSSYKKPIIKRVIAHEGQTVKLDYDNDKIFVDGIELSESYIKGTTFSGNRGDNYISLNDDGSFVVPDNKLFVMGDNRKVSLDSRKSDIGFIDVNDVIGKAQFVVFPFDNFGNVYDK